MITLIVLISFFVITILASLFLFIMWRKSGEDEFLFFIFILGMITVALGCSIYEHAEKIDRYNEVDKK